MDYRIWTMFFASLMSHQAYQNKATILKVAKSADLMLEEFRRRSEALETFEEEDFRE